jgi:hypothetical protein
VRRDHVLVRDDDDGRADLVEFEQQPDNVVA